jgi:hypothetical protein
MLRRKARKNLSKRKNLHNLSRKSRHPLPRKNLPNLTAMQPSQKNRSKSKRRSLKRARSRIKRKISFPGNREIKIVKNIPLQMTRTAHWLSTRVYSKKIPNRKWRRDIACSMVPSNRRRQQRFLRNSQSPRNDLYKWDPSAVNHKNIIKCLPGLSLGAVAL